MGVLDGLAAWSRQNARQGSARRSCKPAETAGGRRAFWHCWETSALLWELKNITLCCSRLTRELKAEQGISEWIHNLLTLTSFCSRVCNNRHFPPEILLVVPGLLIWARLKLLPVRKFAIRSITLIHTAGYFCIRCSARWYLWD